MRCPHASSDQLLLPCCCYACLAPPLIHPQPRLFLPPPCLSHSHAPRPTSAGAGGQSTYESLLGFNAAWEKLKAGEVARPRQVVSPGATPSAADYDLVVVGGNLGILLATALAVRGLRVAVVEAGVLRGRNQDWNASRKEVLELVRAGVLTMEEVEQVIGIEFNPVRCGFAGGEDVWLTDVLNVGVKPEVSVSLG